MRAVRTFASRLGRAAVAALSAIRAPQDTSSSERNDKMEAHAIQTLLNSGTQLPPSDVEGDPEEQMIAMLDEAALRLGKLMLDDTRGEDGKFLVPLETRLEVFKLLREWVEKRRRTGISDRDGDSAGVKSMIDAVRNGPGSAAEPAERANIHRATLISSGKRMPHPEVKRRVGRPTKEEAAERARIDREAYERESEARRHDDSGMMSDLSRAQSGQKVYT